MYTCCMHGMWILQVYCGRLFDQFGTESVKSPLWKHKSFVVKVNLFCIFWGNFQKVLGDQKVRKTIFFYSNSFFMWTLREKHYEVLRGTIQSLKVHQPVIPDSGLLLINLDIFYTEQPQTCGRGGTNPTRECQIPYATSPACSPHPLPHVFLLSSLTVRALELFA